MLEEVTKCYCLEHLTNIFRFWSC